MYVIYTTLAAEDLDFWNKHDSKIVQCIDKLIADIKKHPFKGIGKPEPLHFAKTGFWSRRINHEHRLVYKVDSKTIYVAQYRYHY